MDSEKIKAALGMVHLLEKSSENPQGMIRDVAVAHALRIVTLSEDEKGVLLRALGCHIILNV